MWNFQRQTQQNAVVDSLLDISDLISFGICAKCGLTNIHEIFSRCPSCQYQLGRVSLFAHYYYRNSAFQTPTTSQIISPNTPNTPNTKKTTKINTKTNTINSTNTTISDPNSNSTYSSSSPSSPSIPITIINSPTVTQSTLSQSPPHTPSSSPPLPPPPISRSPTSSPPLPERTPSKVAESITVPMKYLPPELSDFCFVLFECKFENRVGCKIYGNGPVAVEWVEDIRMKMSPGTVLAMQGPYTTILVCRGLYPSVGDIVVFVGETNVEHLTAIEVFSFFLFSFFLIYFFLIYFLI